MADVYSLLCYKGRIGAAVTISIASPGVVTLTGHGIWNGLGICFTTTGILPTGLVAGMTYYCRYVTADTYHLYDTEAHALDTANTTGRINTSGTQSGTHTVWSAYWYNLSTINRMRYGTAGSERAYGGFSTWKTARAAAASSVNTEILEIADPIRDTFTAYDTTGIDYNAFPAYAIRITTLVNGSRSPAFHFGNVQRGYFWYTTLGYNPIVYWNRANVIIDGIRWYMTGNQVWPLYMRYGAGCKICNNIGNAPAGYGFVCSTNFGQVFNNIMYGCQYAGFRFIAYFNNFTKVYNNLSVKNGIGFEQNQTPGYGNFYNNACFGNTTNWSAAPSAPNEGGMKRNAGASGDSPWGTEAITTLTSAAFVDYTNNDFRLVSNSVLRDVGMSLIDGEWLDILGSVRPNYSAGSATADEWDCGPFEYDSGNGLAPTQVTIAITNLVANSTITVETLTGTVILSPVIITGTSHSFTYTYTGDLTVVLKVRNRRNGNWQPYEQTGVITSSGCNFYVSQVAAVV